jgi:alginate O-acetyltransferase complex protein AlgI
MATPANVVLVVAALSASCYWMLDPTWLVARRLTVIGSSALVIFLYNPRALFLAVVITAWAFGVLAAASRIDHATWAKRALWLVVLPLIVDQFVDLGDLIPLPVHSEQSPLVVNAATLGLSFYSLKLYSSMYTALRVREAQPLATLSTVLFFPSFAAGPIDEASAFGDAVVGRDFDLRVFARGIARIGTGMAKVYLLVPFVRDDVSEALVGMPLNDALTQLPSLRWHDAIAVTYIAFVRLFFDFSGFTSIAVGIGLLHNIDISENFRAPFLAHSIQNFWQRWHLSLSTFITRHLFQPMVRATGKPRASMVAAFVLIGLWHEPRVGYLIWGFGHGAALAWYFGYSRKHRRPPRADYLRIGTWLGVLATVSFVALMSMIANLADAEPIGEYVRALVRW